jgi:hypothetical protein
MAMMSKVKETNGWSDNGMISGRRDWGLNYEWLVG